jgi:5S rRNA maturation endonuclease (ribonuclease M5)
MTGVRRVLYRLPQVVEAVKTGATVYVVEGEKDADAIAAIGVVATCNPGGASRTGKWRPEYSDMLEGADVVVIADRDEAGRAHARAVAADLAGKAASVRVVEAAVDRPKADVSDHLAAGHSLDELVDQVVDDEPPSEAVLQFRTLAELCARVDTAGPRRWLIRGIWPAATYGVHGAPMKAQKSWNAFDAAVSVASGTDWLGAFPVDDPGPVIIFAGEGGEAAIVRRLRAICAARNLRAEDLPIVICTRAPHLANDAHLQLMADQLAAVQPRLVVLDPLYLAAGGADGKDLYAMGRLLERPQHLCDHAGTALLVVTHYNRQQGSGPARLTGAGPAEWGRILIGAQVLSRHTDPDTKATSVLAQLDVMGGEVPDQTFRVKRVIAADDPDDLDSPLSYRVEILDDDAEGVADAAGRDLPPATAKLLEALRAIAPEPAPQTSKVLVDWIAAKYSRGLKRETVSRSLNDLARHGLADSLTQDGTKLWYALGDVTDVTSHVTVTPITGDVTGVTAPIGGHAPDHTSRSHPDDGRTHPWNSWPTGSEGETANA